MKAITVRQPWASLIAAGVVTILTRPRPTSYRGRIAIHAAVQRPPLMHLPPLSGRRNDPANRQTWLVIDTVTDPEYQGPQPQGRRVPKRAKTPTLFYPHEGPHGRPWDDKTGTSATEQGTAIYLPLGAVAGSAVLTESVPIVDTSDGRTPCIARPLGSQPGALRHYAPTDGGLHVEDVSDQLPFGDFTPGRWALLLDDAKPTTDRCPWCWGWRAVPAEPDPYVKQAARLRDCPVCDGSGRCDPVPARGHSGLWEWTP